MNREQEVLGAGRDRADGAREHAGQRRPLTRGVVQPMSPRKAPSPATGVVALTRSLIFYDHAASICLRAFVLNGFCSCSARSIFASKALKRFLCFPIQG